MKVLVTGADGFVGQWLVQALLEAGHLVTGAVRDGRPIPGRLTPAAVAAVQWIPLDLQDAASPVRQWADVIFLLLVQALPLFVRGYQDKLDGIREKQTALT